MDNWKAEEGENSEWFSLSLSLPWVAPTVSSYPLWLQFPLACSYQHSSSVLWQLSSLPCTCSPKGNGGFLFLKSLGWLRDSLIWHLSFCLLYICLTKWMKSHVFVKLDIIFWPRSDCISLPLLHTKQSQTVLKQYHRISHRSTIQIGLAGFSAPDITRPKSRSGVPGKESTSKVLQIAERIPFLEVVGLTSPFPFCLSARADHGKHMKFLPAEFGPETLLEPLYVTGQRKSDDWALKLGVGRGN